MAWADVSERPATWAASVDVSAGSSGPRAISVRRPSSRRPATSRVTGWASSTSSERTVPTTRSGDRRSARRRKCSHSRVSASHHWRSSRTRSWGRSTTTKALTSDPKNACRCQSSIRADGRGRSGRWVSSSGSSREISHSEPASRRGRPEARAGLRSHSATGAYDRRPSAAQARVADAERPVIRRPRDELGRQARLADARLAADDQEAGARRRPRAPRPRSRPPTRAAGRRAAAVPAPRPCAGDARTPAGAATSPSGDGSRRMIWSWSRRVSASGSTPSSSSSVGRAGLVDAHGARAVLVERVEAHQPAVHALVERVEPQPPLAVLDRRAVVALALEQPDQPVERPLVGRDQPFPADRDPLLVGVGQEVAAVQVGRALERRSGARGHPHGRRPRRPWRPRARTRRRRRAAARSGRWQACSRRRRGSARHPARPHGPGGSAGGGCSSPGPRRRRATGGTRPGGGTAGPRPRARGRRTGTGLGARRSGRGCRRRR